MLSTSLSNPKNKKPLAIEEVYDKQIPLTHTYGSLNGSFKAVTRSAAGTTIITEPDLNGGIVLTDLIITTDKVALATVTVRFTDDVETINIITGNVNDAPMNLAISFAGRWQGWKNARLELVTVAAVTATVACGYFKVSENDVLSYSAWNAKR